MGQNKNKKGPHGNRFIDLTGQKFERLTVIRYQGRNSHGSLWECLCECGNTAIVGVASLRSKHTRSCGCLLTEKSRALLTGHGQTDTPTWRSWASMLRRCLNPKDINYKNYGGRGITVAQHGRRRSSGSSKTWASDRLRTILSTARTRTAITNLITAVGPPGKSRETTVAGIDS